jgi:hypothetical protein
MPTTDAIGQQIIEAVVAGPEGAIDSSPLVAQLTCASMRRVSSVHRDEDFPSGTTAYALAVSSGDRHGFSSFADRKRTKHAAGVHGQYPLSRGRLGDDENQRVNMHIEISLISNRATVTVPQIRCWVAILAQMGMRAYSRLQRREILPPAQSGNHCRVETQDGTPADSTGKMETARVADLRIFKRPNQSSRVNGPFRSIFCGSTSASTRS